VTSLVQKKMVVVRSVLEGGIFDKRVACKLNCRGSELQAAPVGEGQTRRKGQEGRGEERVLQRGIDEPGKKNFSLRLAV